MILKWFLTKSENNFKTLQHDALDSTHKIFFYEAQYEEDVVHSYLGAFMISSQHEIF